MKQFRRQPRPGKLWLVVILFAIVGVIMIFRSMAAPNPNLKGDLNGDNKVNITDLSLLLGRWNAAAPDSDINGDGQVGLTDLSLLLANWNKMTGTTPTPPTPPTPPSSGTGICPAAGSNEAIPTANVGKFKTIFADDFCVNSATGSWGSDSDSSKVVYTGNGPLGAAKWTAYPKSFTDTYQKRPYRSDAVLSTHDGLLDFHLHPVDGKPAGANPSPLVDGTSKYQTYGRYAARFKIDTPGLSDYHIAWLLWPQDDDKGACAESDFPEGGADGSVSAFHHNDSGCSDYSEQDFFSGGVTFSSGWHTYIQEWEPGVRRYYVDGRLIGTSTERVWSGPERWQLQSETDADAPNNKAGHLLVDWAVVWKYQP